MVAHRRSAAVLISDATRRGRGWARRSGSHFGGSDGNSRRLSTTEEGSKETVGYPSAYRSTLGQKLWLYSNSSFILGFTAAINQRERYGA